MAEQPAASEPASTDGTSQAAKCAAKGAAEGRDTAFRDGILGRRPGPGRRLRAWLDRHFVEREILIRGNDRVRHLRISARAQKLASVAVIGLGAWAAAATLGVGVQQGLLAERKAVIAQQQLAYLDLMAEVSDYHAQFTRITSDLEANQTLLLEVLQEDGIAPDKLAGIADGLTPFDEAEDRMALARESLRDRLATFEASLKDIAQRNETLQGQVAALRATLHASEAERSEIADARARLNRRLSGAQADLRAARDSNLQLQGVIGELRGKLAAAETQVADLSELRELMKADIRRLRGEVDSAMTREAKQQRRLAALKAELRQAVARGDGLRDERDRMAAQLVASFTEMGQLRAAHQALLERLDERTARSISALETALSMTGVDFEPLIAEVETSLRQARLESVGEEASALGGPYLPAGFSGAALPSGLAGPPDPHADRLAATYSLLDQRLDRWDAIKTLFEAAPVAAPMRQYRLTSGFGLRDDPLNKKKSRHEGLDLVGGWREPILATAPGKVTLAGWNGAYGRMVEIDHGHGFKTRFAHMRRVDVEVGDMVSFGEQLGQMGNSGRSTGAHLHYEILFNGKPYDPAKFLKAGRHVFKG